MQKIGKYINPFTDFGFKKLFGNEINKDLLIDFLNEVLGKDQKILDLKYLTNEQMGKIKEERHAIFDLYCESESGEKIIVELQNIKQTYFKDRSIYYATFPIQEQAPKGGKWNYYLGPVYMVGILNFSFPDSVQERYLREIYLMDKKTKEVFYDRFALFFLEVSRFNKKEEELGTNFDKWMFILKNLHQLERIPEKLQTKIFEKLFKTAEISNLSPEEMKEYEESLKDHWDQYSILETARNEAKEEGKVEIAINLIKEGNDNRFISKITGLSIHKIEELRQGLKSN